MVASDRLGKTPKLGPLSPTELPFRPQINSSEATLHSLADDGGLWPIADCSVRSWDLRKAAVREVSAPDQRRSLKSITPRKPWRAFRHEGGRALPPAHPPQTAAVVDGRLGSIDHSIIEMRPTQHGVLTFRELTQDRSGLFDEKCYVWAHIPLTLSERDRSATHIFQHI